jgi:hypothetical protein
MAARKQRKERIVCISFRPDGSLHVEPDSVKVRRGNLVRWVTIVREARLEILFKRRRGSPFAEKGFSSPSRGQVLSAPVRKDAEYGKYPYTVILTVGKCEVTLDPDVEVQP